MLEKTDLHPYQQTLITRLYESDERLAIVPMGGGKTVAALTAFSELQRDGHVRGGIILAPKRVAATVWRQEAAAWDHLKHLKIVLVAGTAKRRVKQLEKSADLWVVGIDNTQWLAKELNDYPDDDPRFGLLIIDEMSRYKSPTGRRSRALSMIADKFKIRWGLTGTPMPNSEADLFQPARIITRRRIWDDNFTTWQMKYFIPDNPVTQYHWTLREEWQNFIWEKIADFCHVVLEDELPPQPELQVVEHWVELPTKAREAYRDMYRDLVVEYGEDFVNAENMGVAFGKLDQIAQGFMYENHSTGKVFVHLHEAKLVALKELIKGLGGQQAMITYWFKEDFIALTKAFPGLMGIGSTFSDKAEAEAIDKWNAGDLQLMAVHPASAGHGLNLQKSHAAQIIHYCLPWSPELYEQVIKRVARQGNRQTRVFNHMILARGTLDELKMARHTEKVDLQNAFKEFAAGYK